MNKTIIINMNGIVFHIEEDAYEILKSYMTDVKRHFSTSADSLEITTDIENRIAEMFSEILTAENKQVIVELDVKTVVDQMGSVSDFENAEDDNKTYGNYTYNTESRRLFRDPDDHLVAGVCSGIANYFDLDAVWIRLAFAISVAFAGSGLILYIILWIVVPKAVTRADKMAMKGEKQNLQGFKKNFEDELSSMRQNISNFSHEAQPFVYKVRDFIGDFFHHFGIFLAGTGRVLVKLVGIFILLCCLSLTIFLVIALFALLGFGRFAPFHDLPVGLLRHNHAEYIYISAFLCAFIPVLSIIFLTLKGIFNTGSLNRSTGTTFLVIWLCALGTFTYYVAQVVLNFKDAAQYSETVAIKPVKGNTYYLKLNDLKYFSAEDSTRLNIKMLSPNVRITEDPGDYDDFNSFDSRRVHLNIEKSDVNQPVLIETFKAKGRSYDDALANVRNTKYIFSQQDTILKFDYRLYALKNDLWHDEELYITLKLPLNSKVVVDERLSDVVEGINVHDCKEINKQDRATSAAFIMTDNGLQCKVDTLVTAKKDSVKALAKPDSTAAAQ
jgi:phage shock protein PspC (stress-responsive transcriptional regulator)